MFFYRFLQDNINEALGNFPAVLIAGARQVGKSTLAMQLCNNYITLDDISALAMAKNDPMMFISQLKTPVVIDEIQKAPNLLSAIKIAIDQNRKSGQFILTGSANVLSFKNVSDTLAGRIAIFELSPLAMGEIRQTQKSIFASSLFEANFDSFLANNIDEKQLLERILHGSYPDMIKPRSKQMGYLWLSSYVSTYIERDVRAIENIRNTDKFARLIHLLSSRSANLLNKADLMKDVGLDNRTLENYISLLELVYQIKRLRPYYANIGKRFVKSEKIFFTDTGILTFLLGIQHTEGLLKSPFLGAIFETFVFNELYKQTTFMMNNTQLTYYRTTDKKEIDFILESDGKIAAIEVKFSKRIDKSDFKHIADLQKSSQTFCVGVIVYMGERVVQFDEKLWAVPAGMIA